MTMKLIASNEKPETPETITCPDHGEYVVRYTDCVLGKVLRHANCPECVQIAANRQREIEREHAEQVRIARLERARRSAGLGARHFDCTLENYDAQTPGQAKALQAASDYLASLLARKAGCLVMCGKVGTGKTHLACAMVSALVEQHIHCKIVKLADLIREIKSTWSKDSPRSEQAVIEYYSSLHVLFIDEVGVQFGSDTEKLLISEIIDNRYQELLPTVLISNLDPNGIKNVIGERCYDRLREDGGKVVAFDWDSHRGKAA